ncbi:MAG: DEAD/DEAH box helicase, partial [Pseudomonadota bacterium]|nr:DEAD/DEAH box helicase [Pseudomonadota bacterium]
GDPFFELGLAPSIVDDIAAQGLTTPTPIQQEAIPAILEGKDLIGLAQTGTGKTAAYLLPLLHKLLDKRKAKDVRRTSVLILAPTRELAYQISDSIKAFSGSFKVRYLTICGGERYDFQIRALNKGVDIIVATPGRFEDLQARGKVNLDDIEHFVLDEGDQMIDLGFYPAIKRIFETLPSACQTVFFSATMPAEMKSLAESFLDNPVTIKAAQAGQTVDAITQSAVLVKGADKRDILLDELRKLDGGQVLVFARTRVRTEDLADWLGEQGLNADMLHGDMRQAIRQKVLRKFKRGELQVLVATDVAARGIDVSGLGMVVNFDLPETVEAYVHRIGRTGRAGQIGAAVSICSVADQEKLAAVLSKVGQRMTIIDSDGNVVEDFRPERVPSKGRGRGRPPRHARGKPQGRDTGRNGGRDEGRPRKPRPARDDEGASFGKPRPQRGASKPSFGKPGGKSGGKSFGKPGFDKPRRKPADGDRPRADHPAGEAAAHDSPPPFKQSENKSGKKFGKKFDRNSGKPGGKPFGKAGGKAGGGKSFNGKPSGEHPSHDRPAGKRNEQPRRGDASARQERHDRNDRHDREDWSGGDRKGAAKQGKPPRGKHPSKPAKPPHKAKSGKPDRPAKSGGGDMGGKTLSLRPGGTGEGTKRRGPLKPGRGQG